MKNILAYIGNNKRRQYVIAGVLSLAVLFPGIVLVAQQEQRIQSQAAEVPLTVDAHVGRNHKSTAKKITSPAFSTTQPGELILVMVATDGPQQGGTGFVSVTGGGLSFTLAKRSNSQAGSSEVWYAYAQSQLSNAIITATRNSAGYHGMIDVVTFKGARPTVGAVASASGPNGAPTVSLRTTTGNSWVWGVGNDWDRAIARTLGANQTMSRQFVDKSVGDTFWSQYLTNKTSTVGTTATLNATAPTNDRWNFVAVEIVPAQQAATPIPTIPPVSTYSIWDASTVPTNITDPDSQPVEVGVKFKSSLDGVITGIKYYKAAENTGTHIGNLWSISGELLASAPFINESTSGWQQVMFASPAAIKANTVYVASYFAPVGRYSGDNNFFAANGVTNGPLTVLSTTEAGGNGVFKYGASGFPTLAFNATNYWVDVIVETTASLPTQGPIETVTPTQVPGEPTPTPTPPTQTGNCSVNTQHVPGGSDGTGSCWPGTLNTGVPAGTVLSPYTGPCTITTAGTVIDAKTINCDIVISGFASNVVIKRSKLNGIVYNDEQGTGAGTRSVTIQDSEINAGSTITGAVWGSYITVLRSNVHGGQHNVHCAGHCTITDSYLHDPYVQGSSHNNAFLSNGGVNMTIRHSTLSCNVPMNASDGGCSGDLSLFGDFGPIQDVTVDNNLFIANTQLAYCFYGGYQSNKPDGLQTRNITATNNVFQRGSNNKCGAFGPVTNFNLDNGGPAPGNVWTGNRWNDGVTLGP